MSDQDPMSQTKQEAPQERRIPAVAEALGYVGGALALAALVVLMSMFWGELGIWGRSGICAGVALAGLIGGLLLEPLDGSAAKRLAYFLLALAAVGAGCTVGFVVDGYVTRNNDWPWFAGTLTVAISGGLLWLKRPTWLQHVVFGVGVATAAVCVLPLIPVDGPDWGPGLVLAFVGIVWGALAMKKLLPPDDVAYFLAASGILAGIEMSANAGGGATNLLAWAVWLGIAASVVLIWAGAHFDRLVVLGVAAIGLVLFVIELLAEVLDIGMGLPVALIVASVALLAGTVWMTRRAATSEKRIMRIMAEVCGYAGAAFMFAGVMTLLGEFWSDLNTAGRIIVPAVATAAVCGFGLVIERTQTVSARRLSQVLLALTGVGVGATVAMIVYPIAKANLGPQPGDAYIAALDPANWASFSASVAALLFGVVVWWFRKGAVTLLVPGVACFMVVVGGFGLLKVGAVPYWLNGAVLMVVGAAWILLSFSERLTPSNWGLAVGCAMASFAPMIMFADMGPDFGEPPVWPIWLGLAVAVALIVASISSRRGVMLGFGAAGVVLYSFRLVQRLFMGRVGGPIMLLVMGVIFIAMAVMVAVILPKWRGSKAGAVPV